MIPSATAPAAEQDLAEQLQPCAQVEQVVDRAEGGRDGTAEEQRGHLRRLEGDRDGDEVDRPR